MHPMMNQASSLFILFSTISCLANGQKTHHSKKKIDLEYSCPPNKVLAIVRHDRSKIDMGATAVTLCGQKRKCVYSRAALCASKGQYISDIRRRNGSIEVMCCQYLPPVQEHERDDCYDISITVTKPQASARRNPLKVSKEHPQNTPTPGKNRSNRLKSLPRSPEENRERVGMRLIQAGPGEQDQLVKAIKKIRHNGLQGYIVTVCRPQCGRSSTTTRQHSTPTHRPTTPRPTEKPRQQDTPPPHAEGGHKKGLFGQGQHCFSGDMTVHTPLGRKRMDELKAGDQVMVSSADSKPIYDRVEWLYHRDPDAEVDFLTVVTKSNRTLRLSANHLIPFRTCDGNSTVNIDQIYNAQFSFARRLKLGHCITVLDDYRLISDKIILIVKERKRGIYSPITNRGTIIVNDILVSCYSSVENQLLQKSIHSVLISVRHFISNISRMFEMKIERESPDIPKPLQVLLKVARVVIPCNVFSAGSHR